MHQLHAARLGGHVMPAAVGECTVYHVTPAANPFSHAACCPAAAVPLLL